MDLQQIKKTSEINLHGIDVELDRVDGKIVSVKLTDGNGGLLCIKKDEYYSQAMAVLVKAPPKMVKRYRVTAVLVGIEVNELFEDQHDASKRETELIEAGADEVEKVEVEVPDTD